MKWTPRIVYGAGTLDLSTAQRPWVERPAETGDGDVAGSGLPVAYIVRQNYLLDVRWRVTEAEYATLLAVLAYAKQHPNTVTVYPDKDVATSAECYLETPGPGEALSVARDEAWGLYEVSMTFRKADGTPFGWVYYA